MVWKVLFGLSGLIFLVVVGLAYLGLLPLSSFDLSGFDKIFRVSFLFLLSFLGYKATQKHRLKLFNYSLPTWPVVLTVLTTADEFIQILSPYRQFEILDILANLSGVYLGYYFIEHVKIDLGDPATLRTRTKSFVWSVLSCLNFPVFIMALLAFSRVIPITFIPRYDFLFLACLVFEIFLLAIKREKPRDLITIVFFHILGLILENYKVNQGVWSYPEFAYLKFNNVPLYSGFMYASVASFLAQIWHKFSVKTIDWPTPFMALAIALTTYLQFFTVTTTIYLRLLMFLIVLLIFLKTKIQFLHGLKTQSFSIVWLMSFLGFIIWIAENISTYFGAWAYSYQAQGWHPVDAGKIVSWSLLSSVNIILFISFSAKIAEFKPRK